MNRTCRTRTETRTLIILGKILPKEETAVESGRGSWTDREKRAAYKVYNVKEFYDETGGYYVPDETVTVFQFNTWNDAD